MLLLAHIGCADSVAPPPGMRPGVLVHYGDTADFTMPSEVFVGSSVEIIVRTFGSSCLRKGRTDVAVAGRRVTIRPYDLITEPGTVCGDVRATADHDVDVSFTVSGTWEIIVHGQKMPADKHVTVRRQILARD